MTEIDIQNAIRIALSEFGVCIRQNTGTFFTRDGRAVKCGLTGCPDILFLGFDGTTAFLEVKTAKSQPSEDQRRFIQWLQDHGYAAGIVRSVDEALQLIGRKL